MTITVTLDDIRRVLDENPGLGAYGLRAPRGSIAANFDPDADRAYLLDDRGLDEVQRCATWFAGAKLNTTASGRSPSSYGVKHTVENTTGRYVSNGAAIVAAILCNVPMQDDGSPNPGLGISRRWYDVQPGRV